MLQQTFDTVRGWLTTPFTANMSALEVALLVGIVLVAMAFWHRVLTHMKD